MVVQPLGAPVGLELQQVEVAGAGWIPARVHHCFDGWRVGHQRQARWRTKGVVHSRYAAVDTPVVNAQLASSESMGCFDDQPRAMRMSGRCKVADRDAAARLTIDL